MELWVREKAFGLKIQLLLSILMDSLIGTCKNTVKV